MGRSTKVFPEDSTPEQEMEIFLENPAYFKNWLSYDDPLYMLIINGKPDANSTTANLRSSPCVMIARVVTFAVTQRSML